MRPSVRPYLAGPGYVYAERPEAIAARYGFDRVARLGSNENPFGPSPRALDAARVNVTDPRAAFRWADVRALPRGGAEFDAVVSNPPFHQGRAAEPELGAGFIAALALLLSIASRRATASSLKGV